MINIREFLGLTYFTSKLDEMLIEFDEKHPELSASQRKEKLKYERIYKLRDYPNQESTQKNFWENF